MGCDFILSGSGVRYSITASDSVEGAWKDVSRTTNRTFCASKELFVCLLVNECWWLRIIWKKATRESKSLLSSFTCYQRNSAKTKQCFSKRSLQNSTRSWRIRFIFSAILTLVPLPFLSGFLLSMQSDGRLKTKDCKQNWIFYKLSKKEILGYSSIFR